MRFTGSLALNAQVSGGTPAAGTAGQGRAPGHGEQLGAAAAPALARAGARLPDGVRSVRAAGISDVGFGRGLPLVCTETALSSAAALREGICGRASTLDGCGAVPGGNDSLLSS